MKSRHVEVLLNTENEGPELRIRNARAEDARRIQVLYSEVYGPHYSIPTVYDRKKMVAAIGSDNYFWLVGEHNNRIIGSLLYSIDHEQRLAKALGAVVSREYRKHNLANTMMKIIQDKITRENDSVDLVYATTRTITTAPQQMTENLGFIPLGIFPNAHRVFEHETHCLSAYFVPESWKLRRTPTNIVKELKPLYTLAQHELHKKGLPLGEPKIAKTDAIGVRNPVSAESLIPLEVIKAPHFAQHRAAHQGNSGVFANMYVPFHEPNLLLISHDQKTEIYIHYGEKDRHSAIVGGKTEVEDFELLLNSIAHALHNFHVSYIEMLVDAYSPGLQHHAINARFLPSAYFPAMRRVGRKRWDYIVFSRSFDMLDFRNVRLISRYRDYLREYMHIWKELYVDAAFVEQK